MMNNDYRYNTAADMWETMEVDGTENEIWVQSMILDGMTEKEGLAYIEKHGPNVKVHEYEFPLDVGL